jgi:hypothetical protein
MTSDAIDLRSERRGRLEADLAQVRMLSFRATDGCRRTMLPTPRRRGNFQKSGLSAVGTAGFLPEYLVSAQTYSTPPAPRPSGIG